MEELLSQYDGHLNCCHHHCWAISHPLDPSRLQNLHLSWLNCIDCHSNYMDCCRKCGDHHKNCSGQTCALICRLITWLIHNLQNIILKSFMVGFVSFSTANARMELAIHFYHHPVLVHLVRIPTSIQIPIHNLDGHQDQAPHLVRILRSIYPLEFPRLIFGSTCLNFAHH